MKTIQRKLEEIVGSNRINKVKGRITMKLKTLGRPRLLDKSQVKEMKRLRKLGWTYEKLSNEYFLGNAMGSWLYVNKY